MSVLFTSISPDNPVKKEDAQLLLNNLGLSVKPDEVDDFRTLLAAVHDCAEDVAKLPDYQPVPDLSRYPRQNIRRPSPEEQVFGQAYLDMRKLCHSTGSYTSAQGVVENPFAAGYSAGGSTSGGAALVAGGLVDITIGGDQGGSIRVPASLCGCVGLKPTHGLVPFAGISNGDAVNDHAGPLARNVQDIAVCLDAISGYDGIDDRSLGSPKPRIHNVF
ncbi:hypothetical protein V6Z98_010216 [Aspergillus fumigatus]